MASPPRKKKCTKQQVRFNEEYTKNWPSIQRSSIDKHHAFCTQCVVNFSIGHGGRDDVKKHMGSKKHIEVGKIKNSQISALDFFKTSTEDLKATNAESLFVSFLIEHNLPLSAGDHAKHLFQQMFPDSKIASKFSCGRTKCNAIVTAMSENAAENLVHRMQISSFSIATDGSNDKGATQLYPLVVKCFSPELGRVTTELLSVEACNEASTDIYFYLDKSSNRCQELKRIQVECGVKVRKILKYGPTRWLSLLDTITCVIEQWEALKSFFLSELPTASKHAHVSASANGSQSDKPGKRVERVVTFFENPCSKLYCLFLKFILPLFTKTNLVLQQEAPIVHKMRKILEELLMELYCCFLKPDSVAKAPSLMEVDYLKRSNTRENSITGLVIGQAARAYMSDAKEAGLLSSASIAVFHAAVRHFYRQACDYILKKFPIDCELLKHAEILDVSRKMEAKIDSIEYFVKRFPHLVPPAEKDQLCTEFFKYQMDSSLTSLITGVERVDQQWLKVGESLASDGSLKYAILSKFMLQLLCIPHSNSDSERVFSLVRKNKTDFRASLRADNLSSILVTKINQQTRSLKCFENKFTIKQLRQFKSATVSYLDK